MSYDREIKYAHPFIQDNLHDILAAIQSKMPAGITCKVISVHRTPADQFELFKQGRAFKNGKWTVVNKSQVVTGKDGFINKSRHNYLPATAFDIGLFDSAGKYLPDSPHYKHIKAGEAFGFDWGGDWTTLVDQPHLEITPAKFFQKNIEKDNGFVWQALLIKAGTYHDAHDGIFGQHSLDALKAATGETERNMKAWDKLRSNS